MKPIVAALVLLAIPAHAGEKYLGAIISGTGSEVTNSSTATPFYVPPGAKLTLSCTAAANVCVDTNNTCTVLGGAFPGVPVVSNSNFTTNTAVPSTPDSVKAVSGNAANGGALVRIVGSAAVTCYVWKRQGGEGP